MNDKDLGFLDDEESTGGLPEGFTPIDEMARWAAEHADDLKFDRVPPGPSGLPTGYVSASPRHQVVEARPVVIDEGEVLVELAPGVNMNRKNVNVLLVGMYIGIAACVLYLALSFHYYIILGNPWP